MASNAPTPLGANAIQSYRMHVSQKYLDLTRQKLELVRLPRDPRNAQGGWDIGVSKNDLEPVVDHWLETYDWRAQESFYNDTLPQFRSPIHGTRVHFVHKRSHSPQAIPLLFVHGWPESFITASKMIDALCNPISTPPLGDENIQAFHVVVPSIPGFGFSDPVPEASNNMHATAEIFDTLMKGLGYTRYIAHGTGWGFRICRVLALTHSESCFAIHTVNPDVPAPRSTFGYNPNDMSAPLAPLEMQMPGTTPSLSPIDQLPGGDRPQTAAYALCDSPTGLLAWIIDAIRPPFTSSGKSSPESLRPPTLSRSSSSPRSAGTPASQSTSQGASPQSRHSSIPPQLEPGESSGWTPTALVNWTMLYWLPGPEVAMRWLTNSSPLVASLWSVYSAVPLGITHFRETIMPSTGTGQVPPQWSESYHRIAMVRRRDGRVRFPAWERPAEVVMDIREFADLLGSGGVLMHGPYVSMA